MTREIPVDDRQAGLFVSIFGALLMFLLIVGVVLIVMALLEGIKGAIRWPFDKMRDLWEGWGRAKSTSVEKAAEDEME